MGRTSISRGAGRLEELLIEALAPRGPLRATNQSQLAGAALRALRMFSSWWRPHWGVRVVCHWRLGMLKVAGTVLHGRRALWTDHLTG